MGTCACMLNCFSHVPLCNPMNCSPLCSSVHGILQARILAKTGTTQRDGTGREEGSGWGTRVYLWQIHVDIWQNQYNIVKLKNKIKYIKKKKNTGEGCLVLLQGVFLTQGSFPCLLCLLHWQRGSLPYIYI